MARKFLGGKPTVGSTDVPVVVESRTLTTTAPITGGGDLSADRTIAISDFTGDSGSGGAKGAVPAPASGDAAAGKFLKADGTWATPAGAGGGAPTDATYVTLSTNGTLSAERVLTAGNYITVTDGGAGSTVTLAVDAATANTVSKVVARDASGNFSAGTITADLTGTASGNVPNGRTITATSPLTIAGGASADLSANRTIAIDDGTTTAKGAVQLEDSTASTSTTKAATPNSVKTAYDLAAAAVPKSTVTTQGDLIVATGNAAVTRLAAGASGAALVSGGAGTTPSYSTTINGTAIPATKTLVVTTDKLSVHAATTSAELAGVISDETGSGALVFGTSPSLTTPSLGVATATSVNGTTIPTSKTLVVTTDKLSVHAATTSSELAGVISDETGSGSLVFATSPTLVTPTLGVATATSVNGTTIPTSKTLVVTTDKLSVHAATSSSELAGVISDETGSGALVFGTSPTIATPTLTLKSGTAPTTEGVIEWDTTNDILLVGDGSTTKKFFPASLPTIVADFSKSGTLATGTGTFRWYNDSGKTLTIGAVRASVGTAPTGASLIVDVNTSVSGASPATIYSTQANRPTIAASAFTATGSTKSTTTIANGDYFTVDIDQVGSTVAGSDLVVSIWLSYV